MEKKENTGTKLNVLLCNLVDYVRGDDRPLVFAVMQEITEYFEQELDKAREEGKREMLKEIGVHGWLEYDHEEGKFYTKEYYIDGEGVKKKRVEMSDEEQKMYEDDSST